MLYIIYIYWIWFFCIYWAVVIIFRYALKLFNFSFILFFPSKWIYWILSHYSQSHYIYYVYMWICIYKKEFWEFVYNYLNLCNYINSIISISTILFILFIHLSLFLYILRFYDYISVFVVITIELMLQQMAPKALSEVLNSCWYKLELINLIKWDLQRLCIAFNRLIDQLNNLYAYTT